VSQPPPTWTAPPQLCSEPQLPDSDLDDAQLDAEWALNASEVFFNHLTPDIQAACLDTYTQLRQTFIDADLSILAAIDAAEATGQDDLSTFVAEIIAAEVDFDAAIAAASSVHDCTGPILEPLIAG
jgi:hypothetical protein